MTKDAILKLAQETGFDYSGNELTFESIICTEELEHFANLVSKAKCKELADKIEQMPFGDTAASFAVWIREQT